MNLFEPIVRNVGTLHIKNSILTPLLWLFGICTSSFLTVAATVPSLWALWVIPVILLVFIMCVYTRLMFVDPNRLQSEQYQLQNSMLVMQGMKGPMTIEENNLVSNPLIGTDEPLNHSAQG